MSRTDPSRRDPEAKTMALTTYSPISSDWPCQVKTPGSYDWERSAAKWLRELVPARYAAIRR